MRIFLLLTMLIATLTAQSPLQKLESNTTHFALLNADIAHAAHESTLPQLRALFALYPKIITLVARKDSAIRHFNDITNNTFTIYYDAKETISIEHLLGSFKLTPRGSYQTWQEVEKLLANKKIDAFITLIAHPNAKLAQLLEDTGARLIPLFGKKFDQLNQDTPYYLKSGIPKGLYHLPKDIKSVGLKYLLVTTADENSSEVKSIVSDIIKHQEMLKKSDPLLRGLSIKNMLENLAIPQHKSAIKAFNSR